MPLKISHEAQAGQRVHGDDTVRNAMRWLDTEATPPQRIAWYTVPPGGRCGRHRHTGKIETWVFVSGSGEVEVDGEWAKVGAGDAVVTRPGLTHAIRNPGPEPLVFVNVVTLHGPGPVTTADVE